MQTRAMRRAAASNVEPNAGPAETNSSSAAAVDLAAQQDDSRKTIVFAVSFVAALFAILFVFLSFPPLPVFVRLFASAARSHNSVQ